MLDSKQLLNKILQTVQELYKVGAIDPDDCTVAPFSLHYHVGNEQWEAGWFASVAWRQSTVWLVPASDGKDEESPVYPDIRDAFVWLDGMLSTILEEDIDRGFA